jgi:hypothetical protein
MYENSCVDAHEGAVRGRLLSVFNVSQSIFTRKLGPKMALQEGLKSALSIS